MKRVFSTAIFAIVFAIPCLAQPVISKLTNNYSFIQPGLPNYGIAPGSLFDVFGTGLAPSTTGLQPLPLRTSLNGVSLSATVNGTTIQPFLYFLSSGQIAAVLPSTTPIGNGTLTVTTNGQTSAPVPLKVVPWAFGVLTASGSGAGDAVAHHANWQTVSTSNAANPGEYITLWGSGLGASPGSDSLMAAPVDLTQSPITVQIGGLDATVLYHGRSGYPGVDQINVVIPSGADGCNVSVGVRSGDVVSNFAWIQVAATGRKCSDTVQPGFAYSYPARSSNFGAIQLNHYDDTVQPLVIEGLPLLQGSHRSSDFAFAHFTHSYPLTALAEKRDGANPVAMSVGSCHVTSYSTSSPQGSEASPAALTGTYLLDAGPAIGISGPTGDQSIDKQADGLYYRTGVISSTPAIVFENGGTFHFENGATGRDIAKFKVDLEIAPPLVWTNRDAIVSIDRTQPLVITWRNGRPKTVVTVGGLSADMMGQVKGQFECLAVTDAGSITIPGSVLLAMPASVPFVPGGPAITLSNLYMWTTEGVTFTAPGLDIGAITFGNSISKSVTYR